MTDNRIVASTPDTPACSASTWTDLVGCYPAGPHHCQSDLPGHTWHRCGCGASLEPISVARLVTHVPTADLPPVPPRDCARILGQLPPISAATAGALDELVRATEAALAAAAQLLAGSLESAR